LEVPAGARFVTCGFCKSRLAIEHSGNTYSTAVIEQLQETTEQLKQDVAKIKTTSEIDRLDAQWERKRKQHLVTGKHGVQRLPSKGGALAGSLLMGGFGLFWTIMATGIVGGASRMGAPGVISIFPLFGLLFVGFAIFLGFSQYAKAQAYERDLQEYQRQRRQLMRQASEDRQA